MTSDATPLFDEDIYVSTVDFSENTTPEPLTRKSVTWLPSQFLRAAATIAVGGILTIAVGPMNLSDPVVYTRAVKNSPWANSPVVPQSVLSAASLKAKLFIHVPHDDGDLEHPDID